MIRNYRVGFKSLCNSLSTRRPPPRRPLRTPNVFIRAQQRKFNLPYLSRTPFQRQIRGKEEDNRSFILFNLTGQPALSGHLYASFSV